jgi:hypothetical protein
MRAAELAAAREETAMSAGRRAAAPEEAIR